MAKAFHLLCKLFVFAHLPIRIYAQIGPLTAVALSRLIHFGVIKLPDRVVNLHGILSSVLGADNRTFAWVEFPEKARHQWV